MPAKPKRNILERDLYEPVRDYLAAQGYTVRAEVRNCDVTAAKDGELIVVELKRSFSIGLLAQATARQQIADSVYVAVPQPKRYPKSAPWKAVRRVLRRLELGLIYVSFARKKPLVKVMLHPEPYRMWRNKRGRRAVIEEMDARSGDYNTGGCTGRKLVTAYRENAIMIATLLNDRGAMPPKELRALGTGDKTLSILYRNVYGWFEREARALYGLSEKGRRELEHYPDLVAHFRDSLAGPATLTEEQ